VDNAVGTALNFTAPLQFDLLTSTVSISDAGALTSGVVTTGSQIIAGDKTFTGDIIVPVPVLSDSSARPATTGWVKTFVNGSNYEASNGWISGGLITFAPGGTTFSVSATTCRFTDYTDESNPVAGSVVTLPAQLNVTSLYPGSNTVGIYITSAGAIYQDNNISSNVPLLYGDKIRLGRIVQRSGLVIAASNSKYPVADRQSLVTIDFLNQITPLLSDGSTVTASVTLPADLSIWMSEAYVWEQMGNVAVSRTNPSLIFVADEDRPPLYGIWRNTAGNIVLEAISTQLDVHNYNPNGTGGTLVEISAGYWVNIPILYNSAAGTHLYQYPTAQYSSSDYALTMVGRFTRLGNTLRQYVVRGFVTVEKDSVDLSSAIFSTGEFFNYTVGGSSAGSSGGMFTQPPRQSNTAWVDENLGDDASGVVTYLNRPYQEHDAAAAAITTAAIDNPFLMYMNAGHHVESTLLLKPFVMTSSLTPTATHIEVTGGNVELDPSFATTADALSGISFITLDNGTGLLLDLAGIGGAVSAQLEFTQMLVDGPVSFSARTIADVAKFSVMDFEKNVTLNGGEIVISNCEVDAGMLLKFDSTAVACTATCTAINGDNLTITNSNSGVPCTVNISASRFSGALTLNGLNVTLNIDRSSLPLVINPITNGAVLNVLNDLITQDVVASLNNAAIPLTASNVVIDDQTYTAAMAGKVPTSRTVNGHALSANVTVGASELGAGTVPRAQLPLPWLSADIPNNAANTSGSAASLSAVSALPDGTTATTQGSVAVPDNSTKVATTAYVDRLRGVVSGVATLDGTGKIPSSQIDLGALGSLVYKGTWDIPANLFVYPAPPGLLNGWFYVVSVGGTILSDGQAYNAGDWMIYNGATWERVPTVDLSVWPGTTNVTTVGTVTTGTWNADKIYAAYGGAGDIAGPSILKVTAGVVSAATVDTDYVSPNTAATITGDKYFSGATTAVTQPATDSSTKLATTAYVQAAANVVQKQVIYLAGNGNDALDGTTVNNAVLTFSQAVALCIAGGAAPAVRYSISCDDALVYNGTNLPSYSWIDFNAPSAQLTGKVVLADNNAFVIKAINTPAVAKGVLLHFTGGTNTLTTFVKAHRLAAGQILVDSSQGTRSVDIDYIDGLTSTDPVITCNANSTLCVKALKIVGLITATGTNAVIDLTLAGDITQATFSVGVDPGCIIKFPPGNAGGATGILKSNGFGVVTAATFGTGQDYIKENDTITLSGAVTGTGKQAIATSLAAGTVTWGAGGSLASTLAADRVLGNIGVIAAAPSAVPAVSTNTASTFMVRNTDANVWGNHCTESFTSIATASATTALSKSSPTYIEFTGALTQTVELPDATTLTVGFRFVIINDSTDSITVRDHATALLMTQTSGLHVQYICDDIATAAGSWVMATSNQVHTLTGDVQGTGRATIATTIPPGTITTAQMANLADGKVLANVSGGSAAPSALTITTDPTSVSSAVLRDASANMEANNVVRRYASAAASNSTMTMLASSPPVQEFTAGVAGQIVLLPDATSLITVGYTVTIINNSGQNVQVNTPLPAAVRTMPTGETCDFICNTLSNAAASWTASTNTAGSASVTSPLTVYSSGNPLNYLQVAVNASGAGTDPSAFSGAVTLTAGAQAGTSNEIFLANPVWNDLDALMTIRLTGTGAPSYINFITIGGVAIQMIAWDNNDNAWLPFTCQMPHTWKPNTRISPHLHVAQNTVAGAPGQTVTFDINWQIQAIGGVYDAATNAWSDVATLNASTAAGSVKQHVMLNFGAGRTPTGFLLNTVSPVIVGNIRRNTAAQTYTGTVFLLGFDFHVQHWRILGDKGPFP
jgi:hypothetical protein